MHCQLTQPESNVVGCGAANCPTVSGLPILPDAVVLVCNYATMLQLYTGHYKTWTVDRGLGLWTGLWTELWTDKLPYLE